jgi:hypothetical protein
MSSNPALANLNANTRKRLHALAMKNYVAKFTTIVPPAAMAGLAPNVRANIKEWRKNSNTMNAMLKLSKSRKGTRKAKRQTKRRTSRKANKNTRRR